MSNICTLNIILPQGSPTSPYIANLVMNYFDGRVGIWCREKGISYTRYCDDMTFSGDFDEHKLIGFVTHMLTNQGFELNNSKSKYVHNSQQQVVTGVVVNKKPQLSSEKKEKSFRRFTIAKNMEWMIVLSIQILMFQVKNT